MKLTLQRLPTAADWMFGDLFVDGLWECRTLEDELREVKVQGETAIPAGTYEIVLEDSPKFGPACPTLKDVKGFSLIRIHSVRDDDDTEGCIGVGDTINEVTGTISGGLARKVQDKLKAKIQAAIQGGDHVWIEVRNAVGDHYVDTQRIITT